MTELVAYFREKPVQRRASPLATVVQRSLATADDLSVIGNAEIVPRVVYVVAPLEGGGILVPFAQYDVWSLRDRFNEALRVMNTLGAKTVTCTTYSARTRRAGLRFHLPNGHTGAKVEKLQQSGFDYRHEGRGAEPRDPGPLRWPDEPGMIGAIQSVLQNGATSTSISIESSTKYKVDSDLAVGLKKAGFKLGASTESTTVTTLKVEATFPTLDELRGTR